MSTRVFVFGKRVNFRPPQGPKFRLAFTRPSAAGKSTILNATGRAWILHRPDRNHSIPTRKGSHRAPRAWESGVSVSRTTGPDARGLSAFEKTWILPGACPCSMAPVGSKAPKVDRAQPANTLSRWWGLDQALPPQTSPQLFRRRICPPGRPVSVIRQGLYCHPDRPISSLLGRKKALWGGPLGWRLTAAPA